MCISADTEDDAAAADFLVEVLSEEAVAAVVRQGYLVPANVAVATSDDFLQPDQLPANAAVFNASVRDIQLPPQLESWAELEAAVAPGLRALVTVPVLDEESLERLTTDIDASSQRVLSPPEPSESPSSSD
jgi:multiple sugar transport system substrate-binding protein